MPTKHLKVVSEHNGGISVRKKRLIGITVARGFEDCGAQGISNIARAQTTQARIVWAVLTIAAVGFCSAMVVDLIQKYYRYEYDVSLRISFKPQLNFPVVTVCNLNPILKSQMLQRPAFKPLFDKDFSANTVATLAPLSNDTTNSLPENNSSSPLPTAQSTNSGSTVQGGTNGGTRSTNSGTRSTNSGAASGTGTGTKKGTATPTGTQTPPPKVRRAIKGDGVNDNIERPTPPANLTFQDLDASHENYNLFSEINAELFNKLTNQGMYDIGTKGGRFIAKCTFKQKPCAASNFSISFNYLYGNCFSFNTGLLRNRSVESVNYPGPLYGLQLYLDINKDEYISREVPTAGVRIAITPQGIRPNPEDEGYDIPPGRLTSIGLKMRNISRLTTPYNPEGCSQHPPNNSSLNLYEKRSDRYSYKGCIKSCLASTQKKLCGCISSRYSFTSSTKGFAICRLKNKTETGCQSKLENDFIAGRLKCDCARSCNEQSFEATISQAQMPTEVNLDSNYELLEYFKRPLTKYRLTRKNVTNFLRENLVAVNIYYEELNFETITQSPRYSEIDLASDIGGVLGLWIGISVLTLFEFLEILMDSLFILFGKEKIASRRNTITEFKSQLQASGFA